MSTIQTVCIFVGGYLLSRLLLRAGGHERFVAWLARRSAGRVSRVVLGVMVGAFALSTFVPNALTVLALIPVVAALRRAAGEGAPARLGTLLALGVIFGGNIGGMASVVGSPANLYLLVNLRIFGVAGREALHFVSWLSFGLPMASGLLLLAWLVLRLTEAGTMGRCINADVTPAPSPLWPAARGWAGVWLALWVVLLVLTLALGLGTGPLWQGVLLGEPVLLSGADVAGAALTALLVLALFSLPGAGGRLLELRDLWRDVPLRGVLFGVGVLVLLVVVARSGLVGLLERVVQAVAPAGTGGFVALLVVVLVTIFATELLSNTAVATVLFPASIAVARRVGLDPLLLMLGVSLASTCAFMTPLATPVNALAFAGIGGVSLRAFLKNGALVNVIAALWIALWARWLIPPVLAWFG